MFFSVSLAVIQATIYKRNADQGMTIFGDSRKKDFSVHQDVIQGIESPLKIEHC